MDNTRITGKRKGTKFTSQLRRSKAKLPEGNQKLDIQRIPITVYRILNTEYLLQKLYRTIFWVGYLAILITAFIPITGRLNEIEFGPESFHIRLDHLLHLAAYFLICIYYLVGQKKHISLFNLNPFIKFILLVIFLAIITEMIQLWVPERAFNVFDLVSNVAGVGLGVGIIRMAQRRIGAMV